MRHGIGMLAMLTFLAVIGVAWAQPKQDTLDPASLSKSSSELKTKIEDAIIMAGGNPSVQSMHLVFAFSTGNFAIDPLSAEATRRLAAETCRLLLVEGDRVTSYTYEMSLWGEAKTHQLSSSAALVPDGVWPTTAQHQTLGGHDNENAIVGIAKDPGVGKNTVIILLTNTAASSGPTGVRVLGANAPSYQAVLRSWTRVSSPSITSGASLQLPYRIVHADLTTVDRNIDAIILTPGKFEAATLTRRRSGVSSPVSTSQTGPVNTVASPSPAAVTQAAPATPTQSGNVFVWLLALCGVGGLVAYSLLKHTDRSPRILKVNDRQFSLDVPEAADICIIAGPAFPDQNAHTVTVQAPAIRIARIQRERNGIIVKHDAEIPLIRVDDVAVHGREPWCLRNERAHSLLFAGNYRANPDLPPQRVEVRVHVELTRPSRN